MPKIQIKPKTSSTPKTEETTSVKDALQTNIQEVTPPVQLTAKAAVVSEISATEVVPVSDEEAKTLTEKTKSNDVVIPRNLFTGFADVLREQMVILATQIAEEYNLSVDQVIQECVPDAPKMKTKKAKKEPKPVKQKLTDYTAAQKLEDLKDFKSKELKDICAANDLPLSGNKTLLMARVWGILHPDQAPKEEKKKRGRKPGTKNKKTPKTAEVSVEEDETTVELNPDEMESVFVAADGAVQADSSNGAKEWKKVGQKFLLSETDEGWEESYGELSADGKTATFTDEPPQELLDLLGA